MIPDYQTLMLPVLQAAQSGETYTHDVINDLSEQFGLTNDEREQLLPSGKQRVLDNRVQWAKSYLKQAGLVHYTKRGYFSITEDGKSVLAKSPERIDNKFLQQFASFQDFQNRKGTRSGTATAAILDTAEKSDTTPDEDLRLAHRTINTALAADLLDRVRQSTPSFFEELIVELLVAMGYGGAADDAGHALGRSGDDGVDGVIDQDPLGVDQIYVQAKRYAKGNTVGAGAIRDFFGALNLKKAQKGIFFTTSTFSSSATQTAQNLGMRIVLIDDEQLAKLMIRYNVGCRDEETLHLKKVDEEFFE